MSQLLNWFGLFEFLSNNLDMSPNYPSNQCMSCGYKQDWAINDWDNIVIDLGEPDNEFPIAIRACRVCGEKGPEECLARYLKRIKSGKDINFH